LSSHESLKDEVEQIQKEFEQWTNEMRGLATAVTTTAQEVHPPQGVAKTITGKDTITVPPDMEDKYAAIRQEMRALTSEIRSAYVAITAIPQTASLVKGLVESSALLKKRRQGDGTHRICYAYAVNCSWSQRRPVANETDKRAYRPHSLWKDRYQTRGSREKAQRRR
jgi:cell division septation protein DedD